MRIAIVVNSFPVLSESFIFNKVMGLRAAGLDVTVVAHSRRNDSSMYAARLVSGPQPPVIYSVLSDSTKRALPSLLNVLLRHPASLPLWQRTQKLYGSNTRALKAWLLALPIATGNFEIVHFEYSGLAVSYLDVFPLLPNTKLLTSCRGSAERVTPIANPERAAQLREVFERMSRVHCVSVDMLQTVQAYGLAAEKAFVNRPSIDATQFQRRQAYRAGSQGVYKLISTGRLHWIKGLEYALIAVRRLVNEGHFVQYDIVGSGSEEEKLRFAIAELNLGEHVHLHGRRPAEEVRLMLEEADIYLLPSLSEGISNAALEAMAMEMPVVSALAGGMAEAITDGREGFLVPAWDAKALADQLKVLLNDSELCRRMGQAGRHRIEEQFNLQRQIDCFVDEYRKLS